MIIATRPGGHNLLRTGAVPHFDLKATLPFTVLLLFFAATCAGHAADLRSNASVEGGVVRGTIDLQGRINRNDDEKVSEAIKSFYAHGERLRLDFYINSPGGDVITAIQIGRLLRKVNASVWVFPRDQCLSSCVFVLAAGDFKVVMDGARVGIHRPYISDLSVDPSYEDVRALYLKIQQQARTYLEDMNLSPSLIDEMFSVPPENVRLLSKLDLERFGLNRPDPIRQEMRDVFEARRLGISREEFLRRMARLDIVCTVYKGDSDRMGACVSDVMAGRR